VSILEHLYTPGRRWPVTRLHLRADVDQRLPLAGQLRHLAHRAHRRQLEQHDLCQHDAKRVHVARLREVVVAVDLGRHPERRRALNRRRLVLGRVGVLAQAKIDQLGRSVGPRQHHVGRLEVAMQHAVAVHVLEAERDLVRDALAVADRPLALLARQRRDEAVERLVEQLHHQPDPVGRRHDLTEEPDDVLVLE
jgi:hypothetical protein